MKNFKYFINENCYITGDSEYLNEEKNSGSAGADTKGKLHEILVGYHLNSKKHMEKHEDKEGDSPKQAHEKLKNKVTPEEYKKINNRAKLSADDIRKSVEKDGHKIHNVHWTSKPGDIKRTTGIESSQKEDASDIMIHTKKQNKTKFHGVSLKVSDGASKHIPVSNPGMESTHDGHQIHENHRNEILKKYPTLKNMNADQRKERMKNSTQMDSWIRKKNTETLAKLGKHLHEKLSDMKSSDLVNHIKTHVLQANPTPLEKNGHSHIRHTTYYSRGEQTHHSYTPSRHFEHIFKDAKNIEVEHSGGASVNFKHKGKTFASHRLKFTSQSDPLSTIKGSGTTHGD